MSPLFLRFINRVLGIEAGYVNDPDDPGGETNWGISKRSYPHLDIRNLTREAAIQIYWDDFWLPIHGDELPTIAAYQALDFAVNSSPQTAIRKLQFVLGVADDGYWGPVTLTAARAANPIKLAFRFIAERADYMRKLKNWPSAGRGWMGRLAADLRFAAMDLLTEDA